MSSEAKGHQYEDFYNEVKKKNKPPEAVESDSEDYIDDDEEGSSDVLVPSDYEEDNID